MRECLLILASAPLIFTAAVDGSLATQYLNNSTLQAEHAEIQRRALVQPSIYIHLLADDDGIPPTANQYMAICSTILTYLHPTTPSHHSLAHAIDSISHPRPTSTPFPPSSSPSPSESNSAPYIARKYLSTRTNPHSRAREQTLLRFCNAIQSLHRATPPSQRDNPLPYAPAACGYSANAPSRLAQHRLHVSSNYVMNLVEDVCVYLSSSSSSSSTTTSSSTNHGAGKSRSPPITSLPRSSPGGGKPLKLHAFLVYLVFRRQQAEIAEILVSGLLQVWIEGGGGFNSYPAGRSCASVRAVDEGRWEEWEESIKKDQRVQARVRGLVEQEDGYENGDGNGYGDGDVWLLNERIAVLWREVINGLREGQWGAEGVYE